MGGLCLTIILFYNFALDGARPLYQRIMLAACLPLAILLTSCFLARLKYARRARNVEQLNENLKAQIAEAARAQIQLNDALQFQRVLLDAIPIPVFYKDSEGRYQGCNKALEDFLGIAQKDSIGRSVYDLFPKEVAEKHAEMDRELLSHPGLRVCEYSMKNAKNEPKDIILYKATFSKSDGSVGGIIGAALDVTALKKSQVELRASEERYRLLAEYASDVIWTVNLEMGLTYCSPSMIRVLGWTAQEAMARSMKEAYTPSSFELAMRLMALEMAEEKSGRADPNRSRMLELELYHKNGAVVPLEVHFTFLRDGEGKPTGVLAIARDITERRRAAQEVRDREEKLRSIFLSSPDAILVADLAGTITECNNAALENFRFSSKDELLGLNAYSLIDPKDHPRVEEDFTAAFERGMARNIEWAMVRKDGGSFPAEISVAHLKDSAGKPVGFVGIIKDISERRRAEEAIWESEQRYSHLFENLTDAAFLLDLETGVILDTNRRGETLLGRTRNEIIGLSQADLHPAPKANEYRLRFKAQADKGNSIDYDREVVRKDGGIVPVDITTTTIYMGSKRLMLGVFRDISERRRLEAAAREAERLRAIRDLAAGMSHNMNNLLTGILGFSEFVHKDLQKQGAPLHDIEKVIECSRRAASLAQHIHLWAQPKVEPVQPIKLGVFLGYVKDRIGESLPSKVKMVVRVDSPDTLMKVALDGLLSAMLSIAANAWEAMPDGGTLTLNAGKTERTAEDGKKKFAYISIQDTGKGIAPEVLPHIFEPLFSTKGTVGVGISLALTRRTVEDLGGFVEVESVPAQGATFRVMIPLEEGRDEVNPQRGPGRLQG